MTCASVPNYVDGLPRARAERSGASGPRPTASGERLDAAPPDPGEAEDGAPSPLPENMVQVAIPDSDHHIMVDQPLALVAALRTLLAAWPA